MDKYDYDDLFMENDADLTQDGLDLTINGTYQTLDGERAHVMYVVHNDTPTFFGHVFTEGKPVAVHWDHRGKADPKYYPDGYDLTGVWAEPETFVRYVYIIKSGNELHTKVDDTESVSGVNVIASKKVVLTRGQTFS